jgi:hypothetical protein
LFGAAEHDHRVTAPKGTLFTEGIREVFGHRVRPALSARAAEQLDENDDGYERNREAREREQTKEEELEGDNHGFSL